MNTPLWKPNAERISKTNMIIMSLETYEKNMLMNDIYRKLDEAEQSIAKGEVMDGLESLRKTRGKYGL